MAEDGAIEMVLFSAGRVVARTSERFIGTTLDFWRADDPAYGEKWGNASALAVDLAPRVRAGRERGGGAEPARGRGRGPAGRRALAGGACSTEIAPPPKQRYTPSKAGERRRSEARPSFL